MELIASKIKLFIILITCSYAANETGLTALADYDCGCPGQNASYICTVFGGVITVWGGTAFNCIGGNEISLRHNQFGSENAIGDCNDGALVAYSIQAAENCYTSRLDARLSAGLQGRTITCSVDDGDVTSVGTKALIVSTVTPSALPPPPRSISILVANNNPGELIFRWNRVMDSEYNCSTLQYDFTSQNCGSCTEVGPRVVSCSGFQTSSAGITCTFTVSSVVCGNITGPGSMQSASVNLKVPDAPTPVQSLPRYQDGRIQILTGLTTTFPTVAPTFITNGIDSSIQNYTITYTDTTFGSRCGTVSIPASSCVGGTCTHTFDVLQSSSCPASTTIILRVVASNILGSSSPSTPVIKEGINNLVNVNFDRNQRSIVCTFLNQPPDIVKRCSANITYGEDCDRFLGVFSGMDTEDTVVTQPLESVAGVDEYCFLVTAEINNVIVIVDGTLLNVIDSQANMTAAIVVPLVLVLLVLILLVVLVTVLAVIHLKGPKSTVEIVFSVEDKPGSLAVALKIFKDCNINILGLNTHLHHAKFDRNAGNGYTFNYVHCMCTESEKEFLETDLKAEIEGGGQGHVTTAIVKVKDSPGALWNAIHKIGNHGINIVGVNTLAKRESIPGYRNNHVKCYCSDKKLRRVRTQLKMLTGNEVYFKYLEDEDNTEERAIQYLVKDEVGALASILKVISKMGINISGVNPDHLPKVVYDNRTTEKGFMLNFIECVIDENTKVRLFHRLRTQCGAIDIKKYDVPPDKVDKDPEYTIVKVIIHNEQGSLSRVLQGFCDLKINIHGVNILKPAFPREMEIPYKHYHLEVSATNKQEKELIKILLAEGLAIDIKPFDLTEYLEADQAKEFQNHLQSPYESAETESNAESELDPPTTRIIQFLVKNEARMLAKALEKFSVLGINITGVNPVHLSREHQEEFVECSCAKDQRQSLIRKLKSYGATNADEVKQVKSADPNYCVVKFSVVREVGLFEKVLKAFSDMGVNILNINPSTIKVRNQYVECCCTEDEQTTLLEKLMKVEGVTDVAIIPEPESLVSAKPTDDPNYCIIKYTVDERAGTLVRALKIFFNFDINIIGVNTLNPAFDRTIPIKFKHNHVVLLATEEEIKELKCKLLESGLAFDVGRYSPIKHSGDSEAVQLGNVDGNDIALTRV